MDHSLSGARAIVTAGGAGIGRAIATALDRAGARVHVCDIDEAALDLLARDAPRIGTSRADVTEPAAVDALFDEALAALGGLDVLVNNAGIAGPTGPVEECDPEDWRRTLAVNLDGAFHCLRRAVPALKEARGGSIVNIASTAGLFGYPLRAPYAAAKWAIIGLSKTLAAELGPWGIRVNAICPGSVAGARMERVITAEAQAKGVAAEEIRAAYVRQCALRRFIEADEVAATVLCLCAAAGSAITGQAIAVDGGTETFSA